MLINTIMAFNSKSNNRRKLPVKTTLKRIIKWLRFRVTMEHERYYGVILFYNVSKINRKWNIWTGFDNDTKRNRTLYCYFRIWNDFVSVPIIE